MTPVKQLFRHDADAGVLGDCMRACIASVLDLSAEDVPHFVQPDGPRTPEPDMREVWHHIDRFLASHGSGYAFFRSALSSPEDLNGVLNVIGEANPDRHWLLSGQSVLGNHMVVCKGTQIVHDPALEERDPILVGPMDTDLWEIGLIVKR